MYHDLRSPDLNFPGQHSDTAVLLYKRQKEVFKSVSIGVQAGERATASSLSRAKQFFGQVLFFSPQPAAKFFLKKLYSLNEKMEVLIPSSEMKCPKSRFYRAMLAQSAVMRQ